jgi:hypothetical protein
MKNHRYPILLALVASLATAPHLRAEPPADAGQKACEPCDKPDGAKAKGPRERMARKGPLADLTPEQREKLKTAREAAMKDPKVAAAREDQGAAAKDLRDTMQAAMLKADPSLQAILDKIEASRPKNKPGAPKTEGAQPGEMEKDKAGKKGGGRPFAKGFRGGEEVLTEEERAKLHDARMKSKDDPAVVAARENMEKASQAFRDTLKSTIVASDPSLAPVIDDVMEAMEVQKKRAYEGKRKGGPRPGGQPKNPGDV